RPATARAAVPAPDRGRGRRPPGRAGRERRTDRPGVGGAVADGGGELQPEDRGRTGRRRRDRQGEHRLMGSLERL
ncbi:MAG: hypothetical protein AVDCRST_MAG49-3136, partial [uncultured Thermomicrobiales bacterium]